MPEKAVDESEDVDPMNVFNVVTRRNHSSPTPTSAAGVSVTEKRNQAEGSEQGMADLLGSWIGLAPCSVLIALRFSQP
jgi:hypothetical protein